MASGKNWQEKTFTGVAAEVTVYFDFVPSRIEFFVDGGAAMEHGYKSDKMSGATYLSTSTGSDSGVTITAGSTSVTIANGADINVAGATVYCIAHA